MRPPVPPRNSAAADGLPDAEQVAAFLRRHPNFLNERPDVLEAMTPPVVQHSGENVVDMQRFMIEKLRRDMHSLRHHQDNLVDATRTNMSSQERIHAAVLAMLEARTFDHLLEIVTQDFIGTLDVDFITLCFEAADPTTHPGNIKGLRILPLGMVEEMVGEGRTILLRAEVNGDTRLFGKQSNQIRSEALVRLRVSQDGPAGLLALASRADRRFYPGQGTELLGFLAEATGRCVRAWLDLPR